MKSFSNTAPRLALAAAAVLVVAAGLSAAPYFPEGADYEAIRAAIAAGTPQARAAALAKVSDESVAAVTLVTLFRNFGLLKEEDARDTVDRIRKAYQVETEDRKTGKKRMITRFPKYRPEDNFDVHPRVGTYQGDGVTVQVVALPVDGFFVNQVNGRFWTGKPQFLAVGLFEGDERGAAKHDGHKIEIEKTVLKWTEPGGAAKKLEQVLTPNPALGKEPPAGATVLIDGQGKPVGVNTSWQTVDRALEITGGGCSSKEAASGKIRMHLEFRTPNNPASFNQGRGNSGTFFGPYEIQINDNFGFQYALNQCGGIYFIADQLKNASLPPAHWQAYEAVFTPDRWSKDGKNLVANARISVYLNGELIHDDLELKYPNEKKQASKKPMDSYKLSLQDHNNRLQFRNYWWVPVE